MRLDEIASIASSEEKAEEFLRSKGIFKTFSSCPFCGSSSIGRVRRNSIKGYSCRSERTVSLKALKSPSLNSYWLSNSSS